MTLQKIVDAIPQVLRPLLLLVVPVIALHHLFMRTPAGPAPLRVQSAAVRLTADGPKAEEARALIEETDLFRATKIASFPATASIETLQRYPLFTAMRSLDFLRPESLQWENNLETHPELTANALYELAGDVSEDAREISAVVAKKVFTKVIGVDPPPQALPPPLKYATRVDFVWKWSATNRLASYLEFLSTANNLSGTAYFQRDPNLHWRLAQIDLNDTSPDLTAPR